MRLSLLLVLLLCTISSPAETLRYGYDIKQFNKFNKKDIELTFSVWVKELVLGTPHTIDAIAYDDLDLMAKDFDAGRLDFASTSALNFVKLFDRSRLLDGFTTTDILSDANSLRLVIRKDSPIQEWKDLSHANIMFLESSEISRLYVDTMLLERRLSNDLTWTSTTSHQQSLLKLFFGKGDAAIVTQKALGLAAEMNPQIRQRLKVFATSSLTDLVASYFRKGVDEELRNTIIKVATSLSESVRGRQLLVIFRSDSISMVSADDLLPIAEAYDTYRRLKAKDKYK